MSGNGRRRTVAMVTALAVAFALSSWSAKAGDETVAFPSFDTNVATPIPGKIAPPDGKGPFPAWVLVHGCRGNDVTSNVSDWGRWLVGRGYLTLTIFYLPPRHATDACGKPPTQREVSLDALGALAYLRSRPDVDGAHIGVIGWSHGGGAAWWASDRDEVAAAALPKGGFLVLHVAAGTLVALDRYEP